MSYRTTNHEALLYQTRRGIFRPGGYGGGIFDGNIAGLGDFSDWITNPWGSAAAAAVGPSDSGGGDAGASAGQQAADTIAGGSAGQSAGTAAAQAVVAASAGSPGSYPWGVYSAATLALQKSTNVALKQYGYCPILEDGKLGKGTCGARLALKSDIPGMTNPSTCQGFTAPSRQPCGGGGGGGGAPSSLTAQQQAALMQQYGGGSNWTKYLLFAGGAAAVIGVAYYMKKRKKK